MRKLYTYVLLCFAINVSAQDTTAFRMIGISTGMDVDYFYDDSTSMGDVSLPSGNSGHAIFVNPNDRLVYAILDLTGGDRNLYKINPFTGKYTLVYNFPAGYINSADITDDGRLFAINGNGGGTNGQIYELNLATMTDSTYFNSSVVDSRALEYNPNDTSLYIYEGYSDKLYKLNMNTMIETVHTTTGMNDELHGAYHHADANIFFLTAYGGEMYTTNQTWLAGTMYHDMDNGVTGNNEMDVTMFDMLSPDSIIAFCPGDSATFGTLYSVDSIMWYKNDTVITGANDSMLTVMEPGMYKALIGVNMNQGLKYIWSETVEVNHFTVPVVNIISQNNDTVICSGDTIVLTGANGGGLQWYLNNNPIAGANLNTYYALVPGLYNQEKINMSGCKAKAAKDFQIIDGGVSCFQSVETISKSSLELYPNPVNNQLTIQTSANILAVDVFNTVGTRIISFQYDKEQRVDIDFTSLTSGVYFITVQTSEGFVSRKLMK